MSCSVCLGDTSKKYEFVGYATFCETCAATWNKWKQYEAERYAVERTNKYAERKLVQADRQIEAAGPQLFSQLSDDTKEEIIRTWLIEVCGYAPNAASQITQRGRKRLERAFGLRSW